MAAEASPDVVSGLLDDPLAGVLPGPRAREASRWERAVTRPGADLARLDELVREAAVVARAPVATVSLMSDRQIIVSVEFVDEFPVHVDRGRTAPLEDTVCLLPLRAGATVAVVDAHRDSRVSNVSMAQAGVFRAYLGVPLRAAGGEVVAVLCVYDHRPREWDEVQQGELERLAVEVTSELSAIVGGAEAVTPPA